VHVLYCEYYMHPICAVLVTMVLLLQIFNIQYSIVAGRLICDVLMDAEHRGAAVGVVNDALVHRDRSMMRRRGGFSNGSTSDSPPPMPTPRRPAIWRWISRLWTGSFDGRHQRRGVCCRVTSSAHWSIPDCRVCAGQPESWGNAILSSSSSSSSSSILKM